MSYKPRKTDDKLSYIDTKITLLQQFGIKVTYDIESHLNSLYPNEIAIENYTHTLIMNHLSKYE